MGRIQFKKLTVEYIKEETEEYIDTEQIILTLKPLTFKDSLDINKRTSNTKIVGDRDVTDIDSTQAQLLTITKSIASPKEWKDVGKVMNLTTDSVMKIMEVIASFQDSKPRAHKE